MESKELEARFEQVLYEEMVGNRVKWEKEGKQTLRAVIGGWIVSASFHDRGDGIVQTVKLIFNFRRTDVWAQGSFSVRRDSKLFQALVDAMGPLKLEAADAMESIVEFLETRKAIQPPGWSPNP